MTRQELAARVAASRANQGLPPKITDPVVLAKAARILLGMSNGPGVNQAVATNDTPNITKGGSHAEA